MDRGSGSTFWYCDSRITIHESRDVSAPAFMPDLQSFLSLLERENQLARIRVEVDPELEITEIATRVVKRQGPALLFERVKWCRVRRKRR